MANYETNLKELQKLQEEIKKGSVDVGEKVARLQELCKELGIEGAISIAQDVKGNMTNQPKPLSPWAIAGIAAGTLAVGGVIGYLLSGDDSPKVQIHIHEEGVPSSFE